jgi:hypothetical protein
VADSAADEAALDADEAVSPASSLEHAATPRIASALRPAAAMVLRRACGRVVLIDAVLIDLVFIDTVSFIRGG